MSVLQASEVRVWTARPDDFSDAQWLNMALSLDNMERIQSGRFKWEADRRAYILAHALRRTALAEILEVAPSTIVFSCEENGKPLLIEPLEAAIFFSHSRSRSMVACAVTRIGPVGIDVEATQQGNADFDLLANFATLPDSLRREAELGADPSRQFFFYWTALEAFWKADGGGLSFANPRIQCQKNQRGQFEIALETDGFAMSKARLIPVRSPADCSIALVLNYSRGHVSEVNVEIICNLLRFL